MVTTTSSDPVRCLLRDRLADPPSSARARLTTLFGDVLLPRAQEAPVRSIAQLMAPLGVNERAVRTALTRLAAEGLVESERVGRESSYRVAAGARETFEHGDRRIYDVEHPAWDGRWTIAVLDGSAADSDARAALARELGWDGMARIVGSTVLASPLVSIDAVTRLADRHGVRPTLLVRGELADGAMAADDAVRSILDPDGSLEEMLTAHVSTYRQVADRLDIDPCDPETAFLVRLTVVDDWRRIALRSPELPIELTPSGWIAHEARGVTARIYRSVAQASETHLTEVLGSPPAGHVGRLTRRFRTGD